jgi:hypothetical protein
MNLKQVFAVVWVLFANGYFLVGVFQGRYEPRDVLLIYWFETVFYALFLSCVHFWKAWNRQAPYTGVGAHDGRGQAVFILLVLAFLVGYTVLSYFTAVTFLLTTALFLGLTDVLLATARRDSGALLTPFLARLVPFVVLFGVAVLLEGSSFELTRMFVLVVLTSFIVMKVAVEMRLLQTSSPVHS